MWYDEIKNYDFNKPRYSGNTGELKCNNVVLFVVVLLNKND